MIPKGICGKVFTHNFLYQAELVLGGVEESVDPVSEVLRASGLPKASSIIAPTLSLPEFGTPYVKTTQAPPSPIGLLPTQPVSGLP